MNNNIPQSFTYISKLTQVYCHFLVSFIISKYKTFLKQGKNYMGLASENVNELYQYWVMWAEVLRVRSESTTVVFFF